jgi:hypothetical protein
MKQKYPLILKTIEHSSHSLFIEHDCSLDCYPLLNQNEYNIRVSNLKSYLRN